MSEIEPSLTGPIDRFFRAYQNYAQNNAEDTLFAALNALHSLDDRVEKSRGRQFFEIPEYVTLKALRNYFYHEGEVVYAYKVRPLPEGLVATDLLHVCLVSANDCVAAINGSPEKFRNGVLQAFAATAIVYGTVVDMNPCIFNCAVKVFEKLQELDLAGESPEYAQFAAQYDWETREGHSHYVRGVLMARPGFVSQASALMDAAFRA